MFTISLYYAYYVFIETNWVFRLLVSLPIKIVVIIFMISLFYAYMLGCNYY